MPYIFPLSVALFFLIPIFCLGLNANCIHIWMCLCKVQKPTFIHSSSGFEWICDPYSGDMGDLSHSSSALIYFDRQPRTEPYFFLYFILLESISGSGDGGDGVMMMEATGRWWLVFFREFFFCSNERQH